MAKVLVTLPKDWRGYAYEGAYTVAELEVIFKDRSVDARGGYSKQVALAFSTVGVECARWLLDQGADIEAESKFGYSPLTSRASQPEVDVVRLLLERGADPARVDSTHKPLNEAAANHRLEIVQLLVEAGADIHGTDVMGWTPLDLAVIRAEPAKAPSALPVARFLVAGGAVLGDRVPSYLRKSMATLYRWEAAGNGNPAYRDALNELLAMFDVTAPARPRFLGEGEAITVSTTGWKKQFSELWGLLVPNDGAAASIQGEVIRIAGRIGYEILNNGGGNWDDDFESMRKAFLEHVRTGRSLPADAIAAVDRAAATVRDGAFDSEAVDVLTEHAVAWVLANPNRVDLPTPRYRR